MTASAPIGEDDLAAYVDDRLDIDRRREVERFIDVDPDLRRRLALWREDSAALRADAMARLGGPVPQRLRPAEIRRGRSTVFIEQLRRVAAAALLVGIGLIAGLQIGDRKTAQRVVPMADAMSAHRAFARARSDVEFGPARPALVASSVGGHLGRSIAIPDLSPLGLSFLGGRLLASDEGPGGMFLFAEPNGDRIAVYVKTLSNRRRVEFASRREGDVTAYFWLENGLGYAVTGASSSKVLPSAARIARSTYGD
jgi:anti-sigma factor RsiW